MHGIDAICVSAALFPVLTTKIIMLCILKHGVYAEALVVLTVAAYECQK